MFRFCFIVAWNYVKITYKNKSSTNAVGFFKECQSFFPFYITHVLTDNGLAPQGHFLASSGQFTDKFVGKTKTVSGNHIFDKLCKDENVDHRLTAPFTPKTNGMVERVNGTIKDRTIKIETYQNVDELIASLNEFLLFYIFTRRHGSLRKELGSKVRTLCDAIEA